MRLSAFSFGTPLIGCGEVASGLCQEIMSAGTGNVPLPPTSLRQVDQNIRTAQTQFWDAALDR